MNIDTIHDINNRVYFKSTYHLTGKYDESYFIYSGIFIIFRIKRRRVLNSAALFTGSRCAVTRGLIGQITFGLIT